MKISIIIPIYQVEQYIADCIRSVIRQNNVNFEVVLIDDCSPDNSTQIACDLLEKAGIAYQVIVHEINRGLSAARNTGIKAAKGNYVYFLDSDDEIIDEESLYNLFKAAKSSEADCIIGNYVVEEDKKFKRIAKYNKSQFFSSEEAIKAFASTDIPIPAWNRLVETRFIKKHHLYFKEGVINEDELWGLDVILSHACIQLTGESTYLYKIRKESIMSKAEKRKLYSACEIYEAMVSLYIKKLPIKRRETMQLSSYLDNFAWALYKRIAKSGQNEQFNLYTKVAHNQRRYRGYGKNRYARSLHIYLPVYVGFIICNLIITLFAKKINE